MPHAGAFFFALPVLLGVAVGITLYAMYSSQEEANRRRRVNPYETRPSANETRSGARRKSLTLDRSREQTPSSKTCTICLESTVDDLTMLPCRHWFHAYCLRGLALHGSNQCPNCRKEF